MAYPNISTNPAIQMIYEDLRRAGQSHSIAEMLACQQPPCDAADRTFLAGLSPKTDKEEVKLRRMAERQGYSVSGATYLHSLARFRGDPEAFIRSRDDIKRLAEKRGMVVDGAVNIDTLSNRVEPAMPDIGVCPKIIERETKDHERKTGTKLRGRERVDFKDRLFEKRKPSYSKAKYKPTPAEEPR